MTTRTMRVARIVVLLIAALPAAARGQDTAGVGAIRGTVTTTSGAPAAAVAICIAVLSRCEVTDGRGRFVLADLRPDQYDVEVVAPARPPLLTRVAVRAGVDAVLEVVLPDSAAIEETVTVSAPVFVAREE